MKPRKLETSTDYRPALLWLMGELERARTADAVAEFGQRLGDLIPAEHKNLNKSGSVKWENYVRWARQALVSAELMGSGGHGIWTITEAGRKWLQVHPDGGKDELAALVRGGKVAKEEQTRADRDDVQHSIRLAGEAFALSKADVLDQVRVALAKGMPPKARQFRRWFLAVDGKRVSVKWVMSLTTGLATDRFDSYQARSQLRKLGLEARSTDETEVIPTTVGKEELEPAGLGREAFYRSILERLKGKLPGRVHNRSINPRVNYLRLNHPAPRTYYEIVLHKSVTYVGLVFYGPGDENRARLAPFDEALPQLEAELGRSVETHIGGESYSTVRLRLPPARLDAATARQLADTWLRFIEATLPVLKEATREEEPDAPGIGPEAFYRSILERLKGKLPGGVHNRSINPRGNYLRLNHPAPRTYYEVVLHKSVTYVGLVFYGPGDENRARLAPFDEALPQLEAELGRSLETHVGGESYSTVRLRLPPARLDAATARQLADTWLSFIEVTLPVLERMVAELGLLVRTSKPSDRDLERPKAILAREVRNIRAYLNGDRNLSPSDQMLCNWIQFCYTFELFGEGVALFKLVRGNAVNPWLYERTQKLARACELRADS